MTKTGSNYIRKVIFSRHRRPQAIWKAAGSLKAPKTRGWQVRVRGTESGREGGTKTTSPRRPTTLASDGHGVADGESEIFFLADLNLFMDQPPWNVAPPKRELCPWNPFQSSAFHPRWGCRMEGGFSVNLGTQFGGKAAAIRPNNDAPRNIKSDQVLIKQTHHIRA